MADTAERNYIKGSAKANMAGDVEFINLSILVSELDAIKNDKGYAAITVTKRKEVGTYGDTHNMYENTYVPGTKATPEATPATEEAEADLPV